MRSEHIKSDHLWRTSLTGWSSANAECANEILLLIIMIVINLMYKV